MAGGQLLGVARAKGNVAVREQTLGYAMVGVNASRMQDSSQAFIAANGGPRPYTRLVRLRSSAAWPDDISSLSASFSTSAQSTLRRATITIFNIVYIYFQRLKISVSSCL